MPNLISIHLTSWVTLTQGAPELESEVGVSELVEEVQLAQAKIGRKKQRKSGRSSQRDPLKTKRCVVCAVTHLESQKIYLTVDMVADDKSILSVLLAVSNITKVQENRLTVPFVEQIGVHLA